VLSASQLGDGYGTLQLVAYDRGGGSATRNVEHLLVDLTPPEIVLMNTAVRRAEDGENTDVELWVADGWVLGWVELEAGGVTLVHPFPEGFPATLGKTWDASLVRFAAMDLPAGRHTATVTAFDAAGNFAEQSLTLLVDPTPPEVQIAWPMTGMHVEDVFPVRLKGSDAEGDVQLELSAAGAPLTTVPGPEAVVELDAADFVGGLLQITVVAIDEAGNRSEQATCAVYVD